LSVRRTSVRAGVAALTVMAVVTAGCGAAPLQGKAVPEAASATAVNAAQLDTGSYPTAALPPLGTAGTADVGRRIEAQSMAPFVLGPWQVDDTLTEGSSPAGAPLLNRDDVGFNIWPFIASGMFGLPFVAGFVADRHSPDKSAPISLRNGVMRFADDRTATDAVASMISSAMTKGLGSTMLPTLTEPPTPLAVPGHPGSSAVLLNYNAENATKQEVTVFTAHGPYVLFQVAQHPKGPDAAAELAARTIDLQVPLIDGFQPSNPTFFPQLPLDPTGLVARTLPPAPAEVTPMSGSAYPPPGALHAEANPVVVGPLLSAAGVDQVSIGQTTLYRAKDASGATGLAQALGDDAAKQPSTRSAASAAGLPTSRCLLVADAAGLVPKYLCLATFDRYAFKSSARDFTRAQQQLAAQYRMLAG
jgi:hypothetical protein